MLKKLFFAALAALALVGCNEKNVEVSEMKPGEKIQLTVNLPDGVTKVTGAPADAQINDLQIFVFDKNGVYETSSHGTGATLTLTCTSGEKQIVALANAPLETGIGNIAELGAAVSDLADCAAGNIVMSGMIVRELTASSTVTMQVERLAAKVGVSRISTAFELDQHKQMTFDIKAIYLINVAGEKAYLDQNDPSKWYNLGKHEAGNTLGFLRDDVASGVVAAGSSYTKEHYFYCYPNLTDTKTRLVVEAMVGGYTYYYPVTLDAVDANTSYDYNLTITRLGSDSPDVPVEEGTVTFTVTVKDWVQQNVNETI